MQCVVCGLLSYLANSNGYGRRSRTVGSTVFAQVVRRDAKAEYTSNCDPGTPAVRRKPHRRAARKQGVISANRLCEHAPANILYRDSPSFGATRRHIQDEGEARLLALARQSQAQGRFRWKAV